MKWTSEIRERLKTVLIVLLSISAVGLGLLSGLFDAPIRAGGLYAVMEGMRQQHPDLQGAAAPAAWPTAAMATLSPGLHHGYRLEWREGEAESGGPRTLYDLFSTSLGEALGSSAEPEVVSREAWARALLDVGVFFRYDLELSGAVLARWLGVDPGGAQGPMQLICLSASSYVVYLYYMGRDGIPHRSVTALRPEDIRGNLYTLAPNGAVYGFSQDGREHIDRYTVRLSDGIGIPSIRESNAIGGVHGHLDVFLTHLGMNAALVRYLPDETGSRTIVEENASLRLYEDGLIRYQYQGAQSGEESLHLPQAIEIARQIASPLGLISGEAAIYLTDWRYEEAVFVFEFHYYMGGLLIWTDRPAATVVISNGRVTEALLWARFYERTGQFSELIPETQAVAAAGETGLLLAYVSQPDWSAETEESTELRARWILAETREGASRG